MSSDIEASRIDEIVFTRHQLTVMHTSDVYSLLEKSIGPLIELTTKTPVAHIPVCDLIVPVHTIRAGPHVFLWSRGISAESWLLSPVLLMYREEDGDKPTGDILSKSTEVFKFIRFFDRENYILYYNPNGSVFVFRVDVENDKLADRAMLYRAVKDVDTHSSEDALSALCKSIVDDSGVENVSFDTDEIEVVWNIDKNSTLEENLQEFCRFMQSCLGCVNK